MLLHLTYVPHAHGEDVACLVIAASMVAFAMFCRWFGRRGRK